MKKTLIALAALASVSAFAQSTVTLSGVADVGLVYDTTKATAQNKLRLDRGNNNRLIFAGVEDLGGGTAATFAFQMRFEPTRGTAESAQIGGVVQTDCAPISAARTAAITAGIPGQIAAGAVAAGTVTCSASSRPLFQGESTVGLRGDFGAVKLGRALTAVQLPNGGLLDPWGVTTVAGNVYVAGFATDYVRGGEGRIGNAVFYTTPNFSGFTGNVSLGFDKGPTGKTHQAFSGVYSNGPLNAMLGYEKNRFNDSALQIGGNYNIGVAKLYAGYANTKGGSAIDRTPTAAALDTAFLATAIGTLVGTGGNIKNWTFGANIPVGAATIRVGYSTWNGNGVAGTDLKDNKLGLGVNYALSKRTSIYSDYASQTRKNNAATGLPATDNTRATFFDLGIAHSF